MTPEQLNKRLNKLVNRWYDTSLRERENGDNLFAAGFEICAQELQALLEEDNVDAESQERILHGEIPEAMPR